MVDFKIVWAFSSKQNFQPIGKDCKSATCIVLAPAPVKLGTTMPAAPCFNEIVPFLGHINLFIGIIQSGMLVTFWGWPITSPFTREHSKLIIIQSKRTSLIRRVMHRSWKACDTQICVESSPHTQICVSYAFHQVTIYLLNTEQQLIWNHGNKRVKSMHQNTNITRYYLFREFTWQYPLHSGDHIPSLRVLMH